MRPPNLSVHMPSGTRISEPVSTGVAVSRPNSVALRLRVFRIGMPMTPNIIQTMKHTVNASVLTISTDSACPVLLMTAAPRFENGTSMRSGSAARHPSVGAMAQDERTMPARAGIVLWNYGEENLRRICARSTQAVLGCDNGGLHSRSNIQLAQHVLHVDLDGGLGDAQLAGDRLVAGAARDAAQDLLFPR